MAAKSIKHKFVSAQTDGPNAAEVRPSNWNDDHNILLGTRVIAADGAIDATDQMSCLTLNKATALALTITQAGTAGFEAGFMCVLRNEGVGAATITPTTSTINGASTFTLPTGQGALLWSDGTNYKALRLDGYNAAQIANTPAGNIAAGDVQSALNELDTEKQAALGFTPVQQGGGAGQGTNKVYIGWSGSALKAQVDAADQGNIWADAQAVKSLAASGYQKLPSGLIVQWGTVNMTSSNGTDYTGTFTFPTAFTSALFMIGVGAAVGGDADGRFFGGMTLNSNTLSSAAVSRRNNVNALGTTHNVKILAIGL